MNKTVFSDTKYILLSMRPLQWVKNIFIFAGLIFSAQFFQSAALLRVTTGFFLFGFAASSIYIFNDIQDVENDRKHPEKSGRPLAAGLLTVPKAYCASFLLSSGSLVSAFFLNATFFSILAAYIIVNIAYSLKLKHLVIIDIMVIASGFVLRIFAGTVLAEVTPSDWLIVCAMTLSLFLGFGKRRQELTMNESNVDNQRKVLGLYDVPFLDQMIAIVTACTVMAYTLYTVSPETVERFGTRNLIMSVPFVLYGLFRYLYLIYHKKLGENPTNTVISDIPLIINGVLWIAVVVFIIYFKSF